MQVMTEQKMMHLWSIGELRTDGWKSQWRLDLEQRMDLEKNVPRLTTPKPPVKPRNHAENSLQRRARLKLANICRECGANPREGSHTACRGCMDKRNERRKASRPPVKLGPDKRNRGRAEGLQIRFCMNHPEVALNINNRLGVCKPCYKKLRHQLTKQAA